MIDESDIRDYWKITKHVIELIVALAIGFGMGYLYASLSQPNIPKIQ